MTIDIGRHAVRASHRWKYFVSVFGVILFLSGCGGEDRLSDLASEFALKRDEIYEAREIIQTLSTTEGISQIEVGSLYSESPDKVKMGQDSSLVPIGNIQLKDSKNRQRLERLSAVARKISCRAVIVDNMSQLWVVMYYGRNYNYGYVLLEQTNVKPYKDEEYVRIPGEEKWLAFRR